MSDEDPSAPMASRMLLPVEWRQPYQDLDLYRLFVGPLYAGEIARVRVGWKASSPLAPRVLIHGTKEQAQATIESIVRNE